MCRPRMNKTKLYGLIYNQIVVNILLGFAVFALARNTHTETVFSQLDNNNRQQRRRRLINALDSLEFH